MNERKAYIRVDLDWDSTGIWVLDNPFQKTAGRNASYEIFSIPKWLIDRFEVWTQWYNAQEPRRAGKDSIDQEYFDAYGLSLAIDLKRYLGADYHIEYMGKEIVNSTSPMSRAFAKKHYRHVDD